MGMDTTPLIANDSIEQPTQSPLGQLSVSDGYRDRTAQSPGKVCSWSHHSAPAGRVKILGGALALKDHEIWGDDAMKTRQRCLTAAGAATFGLLLTTVPALAASSSTGTEQGARAQTCIGSGPSGAIACFEPYGDHFYVRDTKSDGIQPGVLWSTDYQRIGSCWFNSQDNPTDCNYNMKEGHTIEFSVVMRDSQSGEILTESPKREATI
ncbi:hypothetical protein [Saccharopolyspora dendranthemae]|uniref:Uncharacterized protein n=1 Tax=Saccharopolyspora dendranthemae TaxID=1181886 RepID=A0A561V9Q6_9PSEU|nr:hypothetical protein [Saccharopolyspora dendranthemae]TWG08351.1 hypothetical protein FHU35_11970 [Saccharopolyspora dendranthemae]